MIPVVSCLLYTAPSWPNRNTARPIVEVSHSRLPCNDMLLLESPAYPRKCLTCRCLVTTSVFNLRLPSNDGIRPITSKYVELVLCFHEQNSLFSYSASPCIAHTNGKVLNRNHNNCLWSYINKFKVRILLFISHYISMCKDNQLFYECVCCYWIVIFQRWNTSNEN
jgi:hypothetical protein